MGREEAIEWDELDDITDGVVVNGIDRYSTNRIKALMALLSFNMQWSDKCYNSRLHITLRR